MKTSATDKRIRRLAKRAVVTWEKVVHRRATSDLGRYWRSTDRLDGIMGELREALEAKPEEVPR